MDKKIKKIIFTDGTEMEIEKFSIIEILPTDSSEQKFRKKQQWNQQFFDFYHKILSVLPSVLVKRWRYAYLGQSKLRTYPPTLNNNTSYTPRIQTKPQLRMTACYTQAFI